MFNWIASHESIEEAYKYLHFLVEAGVEDQAVCDSYPVRFHWVTRRIGEVANVRIVKVSDFARLRGAIGRWLCQGFLHHGHAAQRGR